MKKMKKTVAFGASGASPTSSSPFMVQEDARAKFRHQSLMQEYVELEKETESMKSKLQSMQQKKLTLMAEVRFLRQRFKYLTQKQPLVQLAKHGNSQIPMNENHTKNFLKSKKNSKKDPVFRYPPTALDLNQKDASFNAIEVSSSSFFQKTAPVIDLNQKARAIGTKEFSFLNSRPSLDLNQQERVHGGKESAKRKNIPFFDLNQVSGEEEELQDNCEPLKGLLRSTNTDEQQNDMKLIVCRNIGNGPNRSGKRKITWQDQVALRV